MSHEKEYVEHHFVDGEFIRDMVFGAQYVDGTTAHTFIITDGEGSIPGARTEDLDQVIKLATKPSDMVPAYRIVNASLLVDEDGSLSGTDSAEDADFLVVDMQVVVDMKDSATFSTALEESVTEVLESRDTTEADRVEQETGQVLDAMAKLQLQQLELEKRLESLDTRRDQLAQQKKK